MMQWLMINIIKIMTFFSSFLTHCITLNYGMVLYNIWSYLVARVKRIVTKLNIQCFAYHQLPSEFTIINSI